MRNIRHPKPTLWGTSPQHIGFDYLNFGNEGYVHTSMKGDEFCGIVSGTVPIRIQAASQSGREPKLGRPAVAVAQGRGDGDAPLRGGPVFLPWNQEDVVPPVPIAPSDVIGRPYVADVGFSQCAVRSAQGWAGSSRDNCAQRADQVAGPQHRKRPGRHPRRLGHNGDFWVDTRPVDTLCTADTTGLLPAPRSVGFPPLRWSLQSKEQGIGSKGCSSPG